MMVSGCLLGIRCRYDGGGSGSPGLIEAAPRARLIPFCPEQLGGLPTPRPAAEIRGGDGRDVLRGDAKVLDAHGRDVTEAFLKGAEDALRLAQLTGSTLALLKDKSPSCGIRTPYCEKPGGMGIGVTAALFDLWHIRMVDIIPRDPFPPAQLLTLLGEA
ncbi:MAG: DUF523 domain-containing protein [Deltaproteobacteria bacterium]|nr:DUF523 domain-containing protein [Deltaproteobacteria bacterium]